MWMFLLAFPEAQSAVWFIRFVAGIWNEVKEIYFYVKCIEKFYRRKRVHFQIFYKTLFQINVW